METSVGRGLRKALIRLKWRNESEQPLQEGFHLQLVDEVRPVVFTHPRESVALSLHQSNRTTGSPDCCKRISSGGVNHRSFGAEIRDIQEVLGVLPVSYRC